MPARSPVAGRAGSFRVRRLDRTGLAKAEAHGKRLDHTSQRRMIRDEKPITLNSLRGLDESDLELQACYAKHVKGAFVPAGETIALHAFMQFPIDLVHADEPEKMLVWATEFAESVFGHESVFAARIDRDEKGQTGVDLFLAPIYEKRTKRTKPDEPGKRSVSISKHMKQLAHSVGVVDDYNRKTLARNANVWGGEFSELAESITDVGQLLTDRSRFNEYNRAVAAWLKRNPDWEKQDPEKKPPRQVIEEANLFLQGIALQTALHHYLRDVAQLDGVQRGNPKKFRGDDWLTPEQLDIERREEAHRSACVMLEATRDGVIEPFWDPMFNKPNYKVMDYDDWATRQAGMTDWEAAFESIRPICEAKKLAGDISSLATLERNLAKTELEAAKEARAEAEREKERAQTARQEAENAARLNRLAAVNADDDRRKAAAELKKAVDDAAQAGRELDRAKKEGANAAKATADAAERELKARDAERAAGKAKAAAEAERKATLDVKAAADDAKAAAVAAKTEADSAIAAAAAEKDKASKEKQEAARLKQDAEAERAAAALARAEAEGVNIALAQWSTGAVIPVGTEKDWNWDWLDKLAEARWGEAVRAGGLKAWRAVKAAIAQVERAVAKAVERAMTPERIEAEASKRVSNEQVLKIVTAATEREASERLRDLIATAPVQNPAPPPELHPSVRALFEKRQPGK